MRSWPSVENVPGENASVVSGSSIFCLFYSPAGRSEICVIMVGGFYLFCDERLIFGICRRESGGVHEVWRHRTAGAVSHFQKCPNCPVCNADVVSSYY